LSTDAESGKDELSEAKQSFLIQTTMKHQEAITTSRHQRLVPDDKFDRHMKRARLQDIESRKTIFDTQTETGIERHEDRKQLTISVY